MSVIRRRTEREETERLRGWLIYLLYENLPNPLHAVSLWKLLDRYNQPVLRRRFIKELDHVRGLGLIGVFPSGTTKRCDEVEQARLIQRYSAAGDDREMEEVLMVRLTPAGTTFQDGITDVPGVQRVE